MKLRLKKSTYILGLFCIAFLMIAWHSFFSSQTPVTSDHATLELTPFTAHEQKDLIKAQEQEDQLDVAGPLTAQMNPADAQARVLNLNHESKQNSNT